MSAVGIDTAPLKGRKQTMQFRGQFYAQPSDGQISPPPVSDLPLSRGAFRCVYPRHRFLSAMVSIRS
jgi:hypothetical protein